MLVSILMPYHDRVKVLENTLLSYRYFFEFDCELLLVEDHATVPGQIRNLLDRNSSMDVTLVTVERPAEHRNPAILYNLAAAVARGEVLCLTNPEVMPVQPVRLEFSAGTYLVCACLDMPEGPAEVIRKHEFHQKVTRMVRSARNQWLQHGTRNNRGLHWCSFIYHADFKRIGMFDEGFSAGVGYEDAEFVARARRSLRIVPRDDMVTIHQYHGPHQNISCALGLRNQQRFDVLSRLGFPTPKKDQAIREQTRVVSTVRMRNGDVLDVT